MSTEPSTLDKENPMIDITEDLVNFKLFLDAQSRCIFSARFGNGKSYFINQFMGKYADDYLFIPIYPVNYQVMDNKDIFELIKRDVLIKLLSSSQIEIENIKFDAIFLYYYFFTSNSKEILSGLLKMIPSINIYGFELNIGNVVKQVENIKQKFKDWKSNIETTQNSLAEDFINKFSDQPGSIYEFDAISRLICELIKQYRGKNPKKKVVLVIEDLDRIDPAHIFRILNVFSAHFDRYSSITKEIETTEKDNKFGFDKIISVCDIENIKNIYSHVYGEKTDFLGYISKFSISKPFYYSLKDRLADYITNHLLDKRLLNYPYTCKLLASLIISRMNQIQDLEYNLRIITSRIKEADTIIKHNTVTPKINGFPQPIEFSFSSPFTYLLALLKNFDLSLEHIIESANRNEIVGIIGKFWLLLPHFSKDITLQHNSERLTMNPFIDNSKSEFQIIPLDMYIIVGDPADRRFIRYQLDAKFRQNEIVELTWEYCTNQNILNNVRENNIHAIEDFVSKAFILP